MKYPAIVANTCTQNAFPREDRAFVHGEDVLPVRHRRENRFLDPLAVQEHALLMAARAEVPRLAGECEQIAVPAGVAIDAGKAVMRVTALDEPLDRAFFHHALKLARFAQFLCVARRALPQRTRPRVAGAVYGAPLPCVQLCL